MISKQQQKYVQSLHNKKNRNEFKEFLVEGEKAMIELMASDYTISKLYCTENFAKKINKISFEIIIANETELENISTLKSNTSGVAIVKQKNNTLSADFKNAIVLDTINDPGNLGTIIRLADWYGIENIICSNETVEFYNPKTISATMGSFCRVNCVYTDIISFLKNTNKTTYGAFLNGQNVHHVNFDNDFLLVIGSESHGINPEIEKLIKNKITIPRIGNAESLNAGVATGIILDNIFRNK